MEKELLDMLNYKSEECTEEFIKSINGIKNKVARDGVLHPSFTYEKLLSALEEKGKVFIRDVFEEIVNYFRLRNRIPDESTEKEMVDYLRNRIDSLGSKIRGEFKRLGRVPHSYFNRIDPIKDNIGSLMKVKFQDLKYRITESQQKIIVTVINQIDVGDILNQLQKRIEVDNRIDDEQKKTMIEKIKDFASPVIGDTLKQVLTNSLLTGVNRLFLS